MKDISEIRVTENIVFQNDVIPFRHLITKSNLATFSSPFSFKDTELGEDSNANLIAVKLQLGEFKYDNKIFPIDLLTIQKRKISFQIQANSKIADIFFNTISKLLAGIDPTGLYKKNTFIFKTTETTCVVTLNFDYRDIFSKKMNAFLNNKVSKACTTVIGDIAKVQVFPRSLAFNVNYIVTDKKLLDSKITISPKLLVIEPRVGVPLEERRFYTSSPTDSETHLRLIEQLEKVFEK